jgi:hypothetical protein
MHKSSSKATAPRIVLGRGPALVFEGAEDGVKTALSFSAASAA